MEPVGGFLNEVRAVGDGPQPTGPRDDRAGAAFALVNIARAGYTPEISRGGSVCATGVARAATAAAMS